MKIFFLRASWLLACLNYFSYRKWLFVWTCLCTVQWCAAQDSPTDLPYSATFNQQNGLNGWTGDRITLNDCLEFETVTGAQITSPEFSFGEAEQLYLIIDGNRLDALGFSGIMSDGSTIAPYVPVTIGKNTTHMVVDVKKMFGRVDLKQLIIKVERTIRSFNPDAIYIEKISLSIPSVIHALPYTADFSGASLPEDWTGDVNNFVSPLFDSLIFPEDGGSVLELKWLADYASLTAIFADGSSFVCSLNNELQRNPAVLAFWGSLSGSPGYLKADLRKLFGNKAIRQIQLTATELVHFHISRDREVHLPLITRPTILQQDMVTLVHSGDIEWVYEGGDYKLCATTANPTTGTATLTLPRADGLHFYCQTQNFDEDKFEYKIDFSGRRMGNGYFMSSKVSSQDLCSISVSLKEGFSGKVPEARFSGLYFSGQYVPVAMEIDRYYDMDGDGQLELLFQGGTGDVSKLFANTFLCQDTLLQIDNMFGYLFRSGHINNDSRLDFIASQERGHCTLMLSCDTGYYSVALPDYEYAFMCDYNSDGRMDVILPDRRVMRQLWDGSFSTEPYETLTEEEYRSEQETGYKWEQVHPSIVVPTLGDMLGSGMSMVGGAQTSYAGNLVQQMTDIDFNNDGLADILNTTTGELLLNLGDNRYVRHSLAGQICFRDLNGDGKLDYVLSDSEQKKVTAIINLADGGVKQQVLIQNLDMDDKIWCYDFDRDGDVDILLPFSYRDENNASFLVMMENDGTGNFKMHETSFNEKYDFVACADVDNDGYYDVVAKYIYGAGGSGIDVSDIPAAAFLLKGNRNLTFTAAEKSLVDFVENTSSYAYTIQVADVNQDGVYEVMGYCDDYYSTGWSGVHFLSGVTPNRPPHKPLLPACLYESSTGYLKVGWEVGRDDESSSVDLTYALRVGTAPGQGDVYYAHANADGTRRNLLDGNMGYALNKVLNVGGWPTGKYYIAVQVIDPMHLGSEWSDEAVFEKRDLSAGFTVSQVGSTIDTVTVAYEMPRNPSWRYDWNFDGAEFCRANADSSIYYLRWRVPGKKTVSLQVIDDKGNMSPKEVRTFDIFAGRFAEKGDITFSPETDLYGLIDLKGSGTLEALTRNGVYENDGKGNFTKVKKIYNTNLSFLDGLKYADYNGDGMADIIDYEDIYTNAGEMMLTKMNQKPGIRLFPIMPFVDMDNDGKLDYFDFSSYGQWNGNILQNGGSYLSWESRKLPAQNSHNYLYCMDMDRDGYEDIICENNCGNDRYNIAIYWNKGNFTFERSEYPHPLGKDAVDIRMLACTDVNNDGYLDIILIPRGEWPMSWDFTRIIICLNNQNKDFDQKIEVKFPIAYYNLGLVTVKDFDNNGYPDLLLHFSDSKNTDGTYAFLYFYPDLETKFYNAGKYQPNFSMNGVFGDMTGDGIWDCNGAWKNYQGLSLVGNTPPSTPGNVRGVQTDSTVILEWDAALDQETPAVQMRYNVSVKKKGAVGEGAFVVSPLNGLNDKAAILPGHFYRTATRMEIPVSALSAGGYEVQVQAIDAWDVPSPFSGVFDLTVRTAGKMSVPSTVCAGKGAVIKYTGNSGTTRPAWEWDGGLSQAIDENVWEVVWNTPGVKKLSVIIDDEITYSELYVKPLPDVDFQMVDEVTAKAEAVITLPESAMQGYTIEWKVRSEDGEWGEVFDQDIFVSHPWGVELVKYFSPVDIFRRGISREVKATFKKTGKFILQLRVSTECGVLTTEKTVNVHEALPVPEIGLVTVDAVSGKNRIGWTKPEGAVVDKINIYKEGNRYNDFYLLASVSPEQTVYIDQSSVPGITSSRYRLTVATLLGAESEAGKPHRSVHVMMNKGVRGWNLTWSAYEGAIIESYRILRGTSPDNLVVVGNVAGSAISWSDPQAPEGDLYYALAYDTPYEDTWTPMKRMRTRAAVTAEGYSNVVSVAEAIRTVPATGVIIRCMEKEPVLTVGQRQLHLSADILPLSATYRNAGWQVIEGAGLATISSSGLLTAKVNGSGTVQVRAVALDGSEVADTLTVLMTGEPLVINGVSVVKASGEENADGEITVIATGGIPDLTYSINDGASFVNNGHFTGLRAGQYRIVVKDAEGNRVEYENNPVVVGVNITSDDLKITSVSVTDVSVYGGSDGQIRITATGGHEPLVYSVDNGVTYVGTEVFTRLVAGDYEVKVKDADGTEVVYEANPVTVGQPDAPLDLLKVSVQFLQHISVYGGSDGKIILSSAGGKSPYVYSVDNGKTFIADSVFTGLIAGEYNIAVKDADDHIAYAINNPVVLTQPEKPEEPVYALEIEDFRLQDGAGVTASRRVTLGQHVTGGIPLFYQVCEDTLSVGDGWNDYQLLPVYELSAGAGIKTVYMRVKGERGLSHWAVASVRYEEAVGLKIERVLVNGGSGYVTEPSIHLALIVAGEALEMHVTLNGRETSWKAYMPVAEYQLTEGEGDYVCRVKVRNAQGESEEVSVGFVYKKAPRKLNVEDFVLQGGSSYTRSRTVTLDHWVNGGMPLAYAVSESPDLRDARWLRYETAPQYTLSGVAGMKTVYFAVAGGRDTSEIVSAQILLEGEEQAGLNVRVWPNPVESVLYVMLTDGEVSDETKVTVHTAMGQLIEHRVYRGREISLDVSRYPFGVLFLEFNNNGRKVVKQILKK